MWHFIKFEFTESSCQNLEWIKDATDCAGGNDDYTFLDDPTTFFGHLSGRVNTLLGPQLAEFTLRVSGVDY